MKNRPSWYSQRGTNMTDGRAHKSMQWWRAVKNMIGNKVCIGLPIKGVQGERKKREKWKQGEEVHQRRTQMPMILRTLGRRLVWPSCVGLVALTFTWLTYSHHSCMCVCVQCECVCVCVCNVSEWVSVCVCVIWGFGWEYKIHRTK